MTDLKVAIVLYDRMTALDVVGPIEVLRFIPGARLQFVAAAPGPIPTDAPGFTLTANTGFDDVESADVVVVPGGPGTADVLDGPLVAWLGRVHPTTRWTTSVCSGSLILAAAGLLPGSRASSHFAVADLLPLFGVEPARERVLVDREHHIITAAGVAAGIDMALTMTELLTDAQTAQAIQLVIEYDPRPPYPGGCLETAPIAVIQRAVELGRPHGAIPEHWSPPTSTARIR